MDSDELIEAGLDHLGRFAFFTRDNPFVSSRATMTLADADRVALRQLLDGELDAAGWLASARAQELLDAIRVGCLPRDLQLVVRDGRPTVGVESIHAFLHAPLFWWLASILWCIELGRELDPLLPDATKGYRLASKFIAEPTRSGVMYRDTKASYKAWQRFPDSVAREFPGEVLAAATLDLKDFYYSVRALPSTITRTFAETAGIADVEPRSRRMMLAALLDLLHVGFGRRLVELQPRPLPDEAVPLPVGLPSSQILANLIVATAIRDITDIPSVEAVATYADDIVVVSRQLPEIGEAPGAFLERIGVVRSEPQNDATLVSGSGLALATLRVGLAKSAISYSRRPQPEPDVEELPGEANETVNAYVDGSASPDWGGRLRTVLRAPQRRDRVPRELVHDLSRLVDEIRVGIDRAEIDQRFAEIRDDLDSGLFLSLRPYWVEFLVIAICARGSEAVVATTDELFGPIVRALEPPPGAGANTRDALRRGLRAAWIQALAQALAVSMSEAERAELAESVPTLFEDEGQKAVSTANLCAYARRVRTRRLIPKTLISVPLAEFTNWEGVLIGPGAFEDFMQWSAASAAEANTEQLLANLSGAVRFIQLHEACLAVHLWVSKNDEDWLDLVFDLFAAQPLIESDSLGDALERARELLAVNEPIAPVTDEQRGDLRVRFAMPSMTVPSDQLEALIQNDSVRLGEIAKRLRAAVNAVSYTAAKRHADVLVLPEWSLLQQQLVSVMDGAARNGMLVIGGGAPVIENGQYSNVLWTGIPFTDGAGHRLCLVPPPRVKRYLSPEERRLLRDAHLQSTPVSGDVPSYGWRGLRFSSLVCFEFADIATRSRLRASTDLLTVSSLNRDWRYFAAIQEATTRDNYSLTVCVNTGDYPGTTIMRPTKSEQSVVASVHGSDQPTVVSRQIDLVPIVAARAYEQRPADCLPGYSPQDGVELAAYKPFPPV